MLRAWRHSRRLSQLDLALAADVSPRHVSLVETGRSRPSADMVLRLATHLDVPLRHRNRLLVAAGFAPRYRERPLDEPDMAAVRAAVARVLRAHEPYPAVVVDRSWNIVLVNAPVERLVTGVDPALLRAPVNMVRLGLDPRGLAPLMVNLPEVRAYLRARLVRQAARSGDQETVALLDAYFPGDAPDAPGGPFPRQEPEVATSMIFRLGDRELRLFSTVTTFGTPQDITLEEISVESYYPADDDSAALLHDLAAAPRPPRGPSFPRSLLVGHDGTREPAARPPRRTAPG
ncbi:helix-turn-helix domain-containing protein [Streptomyces avicenniae]|uniref:helix-turn-helix domain-containing protein n=1 Tax=Streptomyces avicenniae TaxID=500153 RepID=UPI000DA62E6B|nr:helix-turn-helix transcriptional regulator [Streptomyces avicenniae]